LSGAVSTREHESLQKHIAEKACLGYAYRSQSAIHHIGMLSFPVKEGLHDLPPKLDWEASVNADVQSPPEVYYTYNKPALSYLDSSLRSLS
jgi:hypothetical protein